MEKNTSPCHRTARITASKLYTDFSLLFHRIHRKRWSLITARCNLKIDEREETNDQMN